MGWSRLTATVEAGGPHVKNALAPLLLPVPHMIFLAVTLLTVALGTSGCVMLPALGAAAASGGASSVVKAGTEYTFAGAAVQTFSAPLKELHEVTLATLQRLEVAVKEEETTEAGVAVLRGEAFHRSVTITLEPVTPAMTRMTVGVRSGLSRDRATATELLAQMTRALESPLRTGRP